MSNYLSVVFSFSFLVHSSFADDVNVKLSIKLNVMNVLKIFFKILHLNVSTEMSFITSHVCVLTASNGNNNLKKFTSKENCHHYFWRHVTNEIMLLRNNIYNTYSVVYNPFFQFFILHFVCSPQKYTFFFTFIISMRRRSKTNNNKKEQTKNFFSNHSSQFSFMPFIAN